jgi:hypothetical protein
MELGFHARALSFSGEGLGSEYTALHVPQRPMSCVRISLQ